MQSLSQKEIRRQENYPIPSDIWFPEVQNLPVSFRKIYEPIQDFEVFDDDVFVATFPKAGMYVSFA